MVDSEEVLMLEMEKESGVEAEDTTERTLSAASTKMVSASPLSKETVVVPVEVSREKLDMEERGALCVTVTRPTL
jgi:hypothetical protein